MGIVFIFAHAKTEQWCCVASAEQYLASQCAAQTIFSEALHDFYINFIADPHTHSMYYVYLLKGKETGATYVGFTSDLKTRIKSHSEKTVKTTKGDEYSLQWYCAFVKKEQALAFERYLKHGSGHAFAKKHFL